MLKRNRYFYLLVFGLSLVVSAGCETRVVSANGISYYTHQKQQRLAASQQKKNEKNWFEKLFSFGDSDDTVTGSFWAALIGSVEGKNHKQDAERIVQQLEASTSLNEYWVHDLGDHSMIYYGRYDSMRTKDSLRDRQILQTLATQGKIKQKFISIVPVTLTDRGRMPEYELSMAAQQGGIYTLQIGYFEDQENPTAAKAAAEDYVKQLRESGEKAFYSHGPHRSMVTVGVFGESAVESRRDPLGRHQAFYSQAVDAMLAKYPFHSVNGEQAVVANKSTGQKTPQRPFLVKIPNAGIKQDNGWGQRYRVQYSGGARE